MSFTFWHELTIEVATASKGFRKSLEHESGNEDVLLLAQRLDHRSRAPEVLPSIENAGVVGSRRLDEALQLRPEGQPLRNAWSKCHIGYRSVRPRSRATNVSAFTHEHQVERSGLPADEIAAAQDEVPKVGLTVVGAKKITKALR